MGLFLALALVAVVGIGCGQAKVNYQEDPALVASALESFLDQDRVQGKVIEVESFAVAPSYISLSIKDPDQDGNTIMYQYTGKGWEVDYEGEIQSFSEPTYFSLDDIHPDGVTKFAGQIAADLEAKGIMPDRGGYPIMVLQQGVNEGPFYLYALVNSEHHYQADLLGDRFKVGEPDEGGSLIIDNHLLNDLAKLTEILEALAQKEEFAGQDLLLDDFQITTTGIDVSVVEPNAPEARTSYHFNDQDGIEIVWEKSETYTGPYRQDQVVALSTIAPEGLQAFYDKIMAKLEEEGIEPLVVSIKVLPTGNLDPYDPNRFYQESSVAQGEGYYSMVADMAGEAFGTTDSQGVMSEPARFFDDPANIRQALDLLQAHEDLAGNDLRFQHFDLEDEAFSVEVLDPNDPVKATAYRMTITNPINNQWERKEEIAKDNTNSPMTADEVDLEGIFLFKDQIDRTMEDKGVEVVDEPLEISWSALLDDGKRRLRSDYHLQGPIFYYFAADMDGANIETSEYESKLSGEPTEEELAQLFEDAFNPGA